MNSKDTFRRGSPLALAAVAGPILGTLAWLILGLLRPGYSAIRRPVSALGIGPGGAFMDAAFIICGILMGAGVIAVFEGFRDGTGGFARRASTVLLLISPAGLVWLGIFTLNSLGLHNLGAQAALASPIITFPIAGVILRRFRGWRRFGTWLIAGSPLTLALLIGFVTSVPRADLISGLGGGYLGVWQRALATEVLSWYAALGWLGFRRRAS